MNELKIFENPKFGSVRTITESGKTLFCGKDVAAALGYKRPNDAITAHCRGTVKRRIADSAGRQQEMLFIPKGDIYRLAAKSELPGADEFEGWIFDEVLPAIHEHGAYMTQDTIEKILDDPDTLIRLATTLKEERIKRAALEQKVNIQQQQIAEMQPKASYYDVVLNCKDLVAISVIAKDYGWSANKMNFYLQGAGVQYKQGNIWLLYQKYAEQGYTSTKTHSYPGGDGQIHSKTHTYWTQKGRLFIYGLLKSDGILPLMEKDNAA